MRARINSIFAALAGCLAFALTSAGAGSALAGGNGCGCIPPAPPPTFNCCHWRGPTVNVFVNANASAQASAFANAGGAIFFGGGGGGSYLGPGPLNVVQGLNVEGFQTSRASYEATRTRTRKVIIEAVCIDDKDVPHPASQVTPDRDIEDSYDGELYRCIAGTRLQATIAEFTGQINFDHGQIIACQKDQALYHSPGGKVECRAQKPARDCNERSLLRRFGAGVKILTMVTTETYTAYREETVQSASAGSLTLDGGVGGVMY